VFDKDKLNNLIVNSDYKSNKALMIDLNNLGLDIKEDAIKKWRQGNSVPKINAMPFLSELFKVPEQDFFTDADQKREQIAIEEITSKPKKYSTSISNAYLSTVSPEMKEFLNYFDRLLDDEKESYYADVKNKIEKRLKF